MKSRHGSMHKKLERADSALRINSNFMGPHLPQKMGAPKAQFLTAHQRFPARKAMIPITYHTNTNDQDPERDLIIPDTEAMTIPEAAGEWARKGWRPIPASLNGATPPFPWSTVDGLSPAETQKIFERQPNSRLCIILPQNVVVLDIDHRPVERGWDINEIVQALQRRYGLPDCPCCCTPKGGIHLWFQLPEGIRARNWTAQNKKFPIDGVDIRTFRGLATVPPTCRRDGKYAWISNTRKLPVAPPKLCEDLQPKAVSRKRRISPLAISARRRSAYVSKVFVSEIQSVAVSASGGRNDQLFRSAANLGSFIGGGALSEDEVRGALIEASIQNGLSNDDGPSSVLATIESGFRAGLSNPRRMPRGIK